MLTTSPITDLISPKEKDSKKLNKLTYISTYSMGKIGIKKIIEEPFKAPIASTTNNINITNNTNNNTNNTNTNTNSNTNNNSSKNKEIQISKKKLKNMHSLSPNIVQSRTKSGSSNSKYYKNKTNQRKNIIKKNNSKSSMTQLGLPKKEFSKTENIFYIYTNNNININNINKIYSKNKTKFVNGKSYSKKKKNNSNNKLIKEKELNDGAIKSQSHSYQSSYIFSSMSPSSIKREKKKYSGPNMIPGETNAINYNNSFKRDISEIYLKNSNLSSTDINPSNLKLVLPEEGNNKDKKNINFEQKYQMTEANLNYLRVRRRPDFQNHFNNTPKTESTPNLLNRDKIKTDYKIEILNENNINLTKNNRNRNNIFLNDHDTNKERVSNSKSNSNDINNESNNLPKLNLNNNIKNIKNNKDIIKNSYDNACFKINLSTNKKKEGEKARENNFAIRSKKNNNNSSNKNLYCINNKNCSKSKNKKKEIKNIELNKSNSNNNNCIKFNSKIKKYNNIENIKNINIYYKNTKNSKHYLSSSSKNKYKNRTRKNYCLSNDKNYISKNRNKSTENTNYKNKIIDINNKMENNQIIKDKNIDIIKDKNYIDFDSPEELHYFMVDVTIKYKYLNENF